MNKITEKAFARRINQLEKTSKIKANLFIENTYDDEFNLCNEDKNYAFVINVAVNSLTKYILTGLIDVAFKDSLFGAKAYALKTIGLKSKYKEVLNSLTLINGLNKQSIYVALNIAQFAAFLNVTPRLSKRIRQIEVSDQIYHNVMIKVLRNVNYFKANGPVTKINFDFIDSGLKFIKNANIDIISRSGIYELTSTNKEPSDYQRFLLVLHYVMYKHCPESKVFNIKELGIFNSVLNTSYILNVNDISIDILRNIEATLGYNTSAF